MAADPVAPRDAPLGGQAVLEGVMMRGVSTWALAVRAPAPEQAGDREAILAGRQAALGDVEVQSFPLTSLLRRHRALRWPVIRGVVALVESLRIGFRALRLSADAQLPEEERDGDGGIGAGTWAGTVVVAMAFAITLFFLLPAGLTSLSGVGEDSGLLFVFVEKLIRLAVFLGYLWLLTRLPDLRRVFEYHGAEHKAISAYESGVPLTPESAQRFSRFHPRCGTSFLLIVMIVSFFVLVPLGTPEWYVLYPSRVLAVPLVAGLAFEVIKLFGRNRTKRWAQVLMWPGIQLQRLTTREPDLAQLAVAIAALEAVLAVERPDEASEQDRVGMEVVA
jgi:uncharacterized protein YqhQ